MKRNLFTLPFTIFLFCSSYAQDYIELNTTPDYRSKELNFINNNIGYCLTENWTLNTNNILKTTDGGITWDSINLPHPTIVLQDMQFIDDGIGFASLRDMSIVNAPMELYRTTDDGSTWDLISPTNTNVGMGNSVIDFINADSGYWAISEIIYKTTDGGLNWDTTIISDPNQFSSVSVMSMDFVDMDHGLIGTFDNSFFYGGGLYSTTDGINTLTKKDLNYYNSVINHVNFVNNNTIYAGMPYGMTQNNGSGRMFIYKSIDNGITWDSIYVDSANIIDPALMGFEFKDNLNGKAIVRQAWSDTCYVFETTDGALSWNLEDTIFSYDIFDISITENNTYISAPDDKIYKQSNGVTSINTVYNNSFNLYPNPSNDFVNINIGMGNDISEVNIYNVNGSLVLNQTGNHKKIDVKSLNSGYYLVKVILNDNSFLSTPLLVK